VTHYIIPITKQYYTSLNNLINILTSNRNKISQNVIKEMKLVLLYMQCFYTFII